MKLVAAEMSWPLQVLAIGATVVMVASALSVLLGIALAVFRGGLAVDPAEDAKLPAIERAYRRNARTGLIFTSDRFRMVRRLIGFGGVGLVGSFAIMGVLTLLFGR